MELCCSKLQVLTINININYILLSEKQKFERSEVHSRDGVECQMNGLRSVKRLKQTGWCMTKKMSMNKFREFINHKIKIAVTTTLIIVVNAEGIIEKKKH